MSNANTLAMLVDLRHLSRNLWRSPASAGAAILILSVTLGAGASIFAVVQGVLLTPPGFMDPESLVVLGETTSQAPAAPSQRVRSATFEAWRDRAGAMATLEAMDGTNLTLTELGPAERLSVSDATPGFLNLLGVTPLLGRPFESSDVGRPVATISHAFWRGRLAADPDVIGRRIVLGGQPHTIVGVLPERFLFEFNPSDIWRPLPPAQTRGAEFPVLVIARLAANVPLASLETALDDVSRASSPPMHVVGTPVATALAGHATRTLGVLAGAAALAVLIAFANFTGLLLVRSIDRRHELAIRSALGARRGDIAWQLLLEGQTLVMLGTLGGVILAAWMTPVVARRALEQFGGIADRDVALNLPVIAAMASVASACAWLCSLVPALAAARRSVLDAVRRGATQRSRELHLRRGLIVAEVALAFVLLACMSLLGGNLRRLLQVDRGFDSQGVLTLQISLPSSNYGLDRTVSFYSVLQAAVEERLGYRSMAVVNEIPLAGSVRRSLVKESLTDTTAAAVVREAGPGYFEVMRTPVLLGRTFEHRDNLSAPHRVVISQSLAEHLFGLENAVGRQVLIEAEADMAQVIGVVADVKHGALDEAASPTMYRSALQTPSRSSIVVVRSERPRAEVIGTVRDEVTRLDSNLPVYRIRSMDDVVAASPGVPARRMVTATFFGFAALALLLVGTGLFGVVAHDVAARRGELALRMALGADPMVILRATLAQGAVMIGSGLGLGGLLSIWAERMLEGAGFAANGLDVSSVSVSAAVLLVAGAIALVPAARRAARTDPLIALRSG
jgi:putative ABC transport system permease protein